MPAMFLYLLLLVGGLCHCALTSIEIFDMFDEYNLDFEPPTANGSANATDILRNDTIILFERNPNTTNNAFTGSAKDFAKRLNSTIEGANNNSNSNFGPFNIRSSNMNTELNNTYEIFNNNNTNATFDLNHFNRTETQPVANIPFTCPEEEQPSNIGPYEVPTQRDMILHMRNHLLAMYRGFHTKAMNFLKDIKEATQASWSRKMFCQSPAELMQYRRCVRWVGDLSVLTTKSLVTALETMRLDVSTLIQGKICNISSLNIDPIHLIRILAAEKVSLEFALPDFLRQLHACASHCPSTRGTPPAEYLKKARLTDQDFVLRHFYTQQNYNKQLNQQYNI